MLPKYAEGLVVASRSFSNNCICTVSFCHLFAEISGRRRDDTLAIGAIYVPLGAILVLAAFRSRIAIAVENVPPKHCIFNRTFQMLLGCDPCQLTL